MASTSYEQNKSLSEKECLLLNLPPEILYEIFKHLDISDLNIIQSTCTQLDNTVESYKAICKDVYSNQLKQSKSKIMPAGYYDDDDEEEDEDEFYDDDYDDNDDDLENLRNDMLDNLSFGSNYDEELEEEFNGDGGDNERDVINN